MSTYRWFWIFHETASVVRPMISERMLTAGCCVLLPSARFFVPPSRAGSRYTSNRNARVLSASLHEGEGARRSTNSRTDASIDEGDATSPGSRKRSRRARPKSTPRGASPAPHLVDSINPAAYGEANVLTLARCHELLREAHDYLARRGMDAVRRATLVESAASWGAR